MSIKVNLKKKKHHEKVKGDVLHTKSGAWRRIGDGVIVFISPGTRGDESTVFQINEEPGTITDLTAIHSGWLSKKYTYIKIPGGITITIE